MRGFRVLAALGLATAIAGGTAPARADGGAFIEFNKTYYLAGDRAIAKAFVLIPEAKRAILDRGPFFAFAVPRGVVLQEGRAVPAGAFRLSTLSVRPRTHDTELDLAFTMPRLPSGNYTVQICNDPCTVSGFREPLTGFFSIVQTARERELLIDEQHLRGKIWSLKRKLKRSDRVVAATGQELSTLRRDHDALTTQLVQLRNERDALAVRGHADGPSIWVGLTLGLAAVASVLAFAWRRRRRRSVSPSADLDPLPVDEGMQRETGLP